ncbi:reverse transcriptase domain-containing protein [Tanacetum coccineum]
MRTRNSNFPNNSNLTILRRRNRGRAPNVVEPELRTIIAPMAERTMEELPRAPTEGYEESIVLPEINADHFEIITNLLQLVQANPFHGLENKNPHAHINSFKRITSTLRFRNVSNDVIKLMMFPYSFEGAAKTWESVSKTDEIIDKLADQLSTLVEIVSKKVITPAPVKAVEETCVTCGGAHSWYNYPNTDNNQASVCATTSSYNQVNPQNRVSNQMAPPVDSFKTKPQTFSGTLSNPKCEMKAITTQSGVAYEGPSIPTNPSTKKVVERETEEIMDKEQTNFQGSTAHIPPPVNLTPILEPDVSFATFADALLLMPRFAPTIKSLLMNKEKLLELAKIPLNENCWAMLLKKLPKKLRDLGNYLLLKKLPEKLGDPDMFLIPCNFSGMDVCHALADLGASINLMPLSIWKRLSLPELTPTQMTLELADRSITHPKRLAKYVYVKVGKFHFPTDFVVVDFEADPRVPLILGRSFLRTGRALIDVYGEEIILPVDNEAITFNLDQTTRYSFINDKSVNRIDIIDEVCEEYAPELLGFSNKSSGGNPTLTSKPLTSEFILEEIEAYLKDDSISPEINHADCDPEGDICLIEKLLNNDPFQLPPMDLKQGEITKAKSSIEEPPELELKDLPSHLEYAYLEENDKLPVIIAKGLKDDEKKALLKVLKSHKRAIAWKITDIKGIDPRFCTHKILMEDDYKPTVQSQRRVNPKIHEVIKKEVLKLLDAGMIYPISDSPWVSPVHCVPKKGGITVVANEENELIPTRLVTGWRVCIDYRKVFPNTNRSPRPGENYLLTCPYGTFAYRRMPFGLCNAPDTFQRCMMAIFHDMIEKTMEVFMDDFSVFGDSFDSCLSNLEKMLKQCEDTHLVLNWEKCHFMCREGILLGHEISKTRIEVDRAKVDVIATLPHPTTVKGTLKKKLTEAPILVVPNWNLPFELMCDASDFAIGVDLGQRKMKHFQPIHYASKTMTEAQIHYTTTEKEMLAVVYAFEKFWPYLVLSKSIVYMDHSALKYLMNKQDAKPRLLRCVLLLQEFDITIRDKKGSENLAADHLSRLENPHKDVLENKDINEHFPLEDSWSYILGDKYCLGWCNLVLLTTYHPQTSGQVEAFRTAFKTPIGCMPYKLVYEKSCHLPIELEHKAYWALKHANFDLKTAGDHRKLQLNELNELRDQAYENCLIYKERTKKLHDSKIKNRIFNVGDRVLLFNSCLKIFSGKLKTRWSGPFTNTKVFPYGIIELSQPDGPNFKVNGHRVKHYFGGDLPPKVVQDLHTFSKDE